MAKRSTSWAHALETDATTSTTVPEISFAVITIASPTLASWYTSVRPRAPGQAALE